MSCEYNLRTFPVQDNWLVNLEELDDVFVPLCQCSGKALFRISNPFGFPRDIKLEKIPCFIHEFDRQPLAL